MQKRAILIIKYIFISAVFVISINNQYFSEYDPIRLTSLNVLAFILTVLLLYYYDSKKDKKDRIFFILSFLYSFALIVGKSINDTNSIYSTLVPITNLLNTVIKLCSFTYVFGVVIIVIINKIKSINFKQINININKRKFILMWIIIFATFIPVLIAYYPGISSYDIHALNCQALGLTPYSNLQPPLFTLIYQIIIKIGTTIGIHPIVLYAVLQMLLLSYSLAYLLRYLINKKSKIIYIVISCIFIVINPIIAIFSIIPVKDVANASLMILISLKILEYLNSNNKNKLYLISILILVSCLFRHNMFYAYSLSIIAVLIISKKKYIDLIISICISLIICLLINGPVFSMLGIVKDNTQESLSVPIQQIATVVERHEEKIDEDLKEDINKYLPIDKIKPQYNPRFADPIKAEFKSQEFNNSKISFIKAYIDLGFKYPCDYIDAFLTLNLPIWYPDSNPIDEFSKVQYIEDQQGASIDIGSFNFDQVNFNTPIYNFYHKFATFEFFDCTPILSNLVSLSSPVWILLFSLFIYIREREYNLIITIIPYLALWITLMGGPVSNMRYVFPIFIMYPLFICTVFEKK